MVVESRELLQVSVLPTVITEIDHIASGISGVIDATIVDKVRYVTTGRVEVTNIPTDYFKAGQDIGTVANVASGTIKVTDITGTIADKTRYIASGTVNVANWPTTYDVSDRSGRLLGVITSVSSGRIDIATLGNIASGKVDIANITGTITDKTRYISTGTVVVTSGSVYVANMPTDYFKAGQNVNVTSGLVEVARLNPMLKGSIFNTLIGANTNFFSSDLTPTYSPTIFRIHITNSTAGKLNVKRTRGATTVTETLNGGNDLSSGCAYIFDIAVESGDSINLQYSVTGTVLVCKVMEVGASA